MSFKICHQLELNENSLFLGLIVVVSNRSGLGLMAPDLPAWDAGNLIAKLAMKIALLYWCATSWPCQMRLVGASFTTIWSTYTVVEILILFPLYLGKIIEQKVRRQLSKFLVLSDLRVICNKVKSPASGMKNVRFSDGPDFPDIWTWCPVEP